MESNKETETTTPCGTPPPTPSVSQEMSSDKHIGQVKWFNNKAGYGFITTTSVSNEDTQNDIFVHYSTVVAENAPYKYLVLGEYVEFQLAKSANTQHEYQAVNVTGIQGGKLMCETRQMNRPRTTVENEGGDATVTRGPPPPISRRKPELRPRRGVRDETTSEKDTDGFKRVNKKRKPVANNDNTKA
jgi:cold shock CspA family protein